MKLSFKKKIRQKYVTSKVRKDVLDLFSQVELYEYCIRNDVVAEVHESIAVACKNSFSCPTERHNNKIEDMQFIVKKFYSILRNVKKRMNNDELEIFKSFFLNHEQDSDIIQKLNIQRVKYYELKGYVYFLLAIGFNIINPECIEVNNRLKSIC